jgi:hypothetical protein
MKEGLERVRVALDGRYEGDRKRWQRGLAPLLPAGGLVPTGGPAKTPSGSVAARDGARAAGAKPAVRPGAFGLPRWFVPVALGGLVAAVALFVVWVVALGARAPEAPSAGAGDGTGVATRAAPVAAKKGFVVPRLATPTAAPEPGTDRALEATLILRQMLAALVDNNYDAFLAYGHDGFKARVLKSNVTEISGRLGPRLRAGFDLHMLGELKREDHELFVYKLEFRDGSDDALIRFSLEGSQVVGFFEN